MLCGIVAVQSTRSLEPDGPSQTSSFAMRLSNETFLFHALPLTGYRAIESQARRSGNRSDHASIHAFIDLQVVYMHVVGGRPHISTCRNV